MSNSESAVDNRRIAKNTLMLYFRMLFVTVVSLYTSRVALEALGVEDYGIYNVVGGVVMLLSFMNAAMSSGTQRFLTYALGRGDQTAVTRIFSSSLSIHILISLVIVLFAETIGLWFLNHRLNIPVDRLYAANWVYQFSIISAVVSITQVPYTASIIAHERMNIYAFVSIFDGVARLGVLYLIINLNFDKLILYGGLYLLLSVVVALIYRGYSLKNFKFTRYKFYYERSLWRELGSYAVWNLWGNLAAVGFTQGVNILVNIFFGPVLNSARAISIQVSGALVQFVGSFQTAMNPQIVKSYARDQTSEMVELIYRGSKFSFMMLWIISMPLLVNLDYVLTLWLRDVPSHTLIFTQWIIINALVDSLSGPLMTGIQATGRIKLYQSLVGGILLLNVPLSYLFLKLGAPAVVVFYVLVSCSVMALAARLYIIQRYLPISILHFIGRVLAPVLLLSSIGVVGVLSGLFERDTLWGVVASGLLVGLIAVVAVATVGLSRGERAWLWRKVKR
ncbi:MAG: lipopolysaccharide biosynthesis protein [Rikenellaceae bacterium]